jgi:2-keto-4-pentenoate hydratase/2-oxohepta-3-ene-1,7-dioic acid hydratase in catechol pathway
MRIVSFRTPGKSHAFGVHRPEGVIDLSDRAGFSELLQLSPAAIADLAESAKRAGAAPLPFDQLDLLPVIPRPGKFVCLGLNYLEHAKEGGTHKLPAYPTLFMRGPTSLQAAGKPIVRSGVSVTLDYEAELAVIIGKGGRAIPEERALDHVAGYSIFNDVTVREYQRITTQWTPGKNFDRTGAFGPEMVTADELPPGAAGLGIRSRVNGTLMQDGNTADMMFPVARTIALISEIMTWEPGDVIAMGTPAGVGYARTPPVWLRDGDRCEIEIERIGTLSNTVRDDDRAQRPRAALSEAS